jgi:hypothetical protein
MQEGTSLGLFSVGLINSETPEMCITKRRVLIARALSQLRAAVPLTLDKYVDPGNLPLQSDRFELIGYIDEDFTWLIDCFSLDRHLLDLSSLKGPNFDIVHWLHLRKTEIYDQLLFD